MARLQRVAPTGVPLHIIQRGVNREKCFSSENDYHAYIHWLKQYSQKYKMDIHAWVLMTNHVHLLCTPCTNSNISKMMQSLGRQYVRYFNHKYDRTGTLWEGRFKSCLVETQNYLFQLYKYIEMNPVRAGMVDAPADYKWSSYHHNALGLFSDMCRPHQLYISLGESSRERQNAYSLLFEAEMAQQEIEEIRQSINKGTALGSDTFKNNAKVMTGVEVDRQCR